ncbi:class I SAM-dependent methyltransferase [Paractinoplanes ovalisporus]|uniref:class I SAM-dependent methyltransferase n=1 Tax=Paractinoplanes ovalisporus TaxID=2810368 RepID=UPI001F193B50|nr:class I SAM-dependent methyltransferase [Actinoplanes ovalisporus]
MAYAERPVGNALEIGAGTGKATRLFAGRGIAVTATEPDEGMLAELRRHVPKDVRTVRAAFEELPVGETYGLVYAAASLHWTRPEGRWARLGGCSRRVGCSPASAGRSIWLTRRWMRRFGRSGRRFSRATT